MLAKRFKLPIEEFSKKGRKRTLSFSCFSLKILPNSCGYNRIGVVVPARAVPQATGRNRIKRQIFDLSPRFPQKSLDILVYVNPGAKNLLESEKITADMEKAADMLR